MVVSANRLLTNGLIYYASPKFAKAALIASAAFPSLRLKFYNDERGFGFLTDDSGGPDIFVHATAFRDAGLGPIDIVVNDRFSYDTDRRRDGRFVALDVRQAA